MGLAEMLAGAAPTKKRGEQRASAEQQKAGAAASAGANSLREEIRVELSYTDRCWQCQGCHSLALPDLGLH